MTGVAVTGYLQVLVLWVCTQLIGAYWGPPLAVLLSLLVLVICATGVAAVIAAFARTTGQASALSTMISLVAAAASGNYFPRENLPQWLQSVSLIVPNAWGIEIFSTFQRGGGLVDALPFMGAVLALGIVYYAIAIVGFRRQYI
jgi:ABC-2 type transport system permease protein